VFRVQAASGSSFPFSAAKHNLVILQDQGLRQKRDAEAFGVKKFQVLRPLPGPKDYGWKMIDGRTRSRLYFTCARGKQKDARERGGKKGFAPVVF
jgi:hypothetical protein